MPESKYKKKKETYTKKLHKGLTQFQRQKKKLGLDKKKKGKK